MTTTIENTNTIASQTPATATAPPLYDKPVVKKEFKTEAEYHEWLSNEVNKQGIWYLKNNYNKVNEEREELLAEGRFLKNSQTFCCDRYGTPRKPKVTVEEKKKRKRGPSKKVSCKAHFCKKLFTNGQVEVLYHWQHINHDPFEDLAKRNEKQKNKKVGIEELRQKALEKCKELEQKVYIALEECKSNPQRLKEIEATLAKCLEDMNNCMNPQ